MFNTEMVRAILENRKNTTRRVVKPQPMIGSTIYPNIDVSGKVCAEIWGNGAVKYIKQPYNRGDILYVRETWAELYYVDEHGYTHYDQPMYYYAADGVPDITLIDPDGFEEDDQRIRWRPSIYMPKEAARIYLHVTDVRVERLQEMRAEDSLREGVKLHLEGCLNGEAPLKPFADLWDSTVRNTDRDRYGWAANPWVWVVEFKRIPHDLPCNKEVSE